MTSSDELQLPRDPGPMPAPLRDAFALARDVDRASSSHLPLPADEVVDALAELSGPEEAHLETVERLLSSTAGAGALAHLVAAKISTRGIDDRLNQGLAVEAAVATEARSFAGGAGRRRDPFAGVKPLLLAASLMLVAGTSWYVLTLPQAGDEVRTAESALELQAVPPVVVRTPITLRWKALRSDARYSVEVLDSNDAPVFTAETTQTQAVVPASTLKPGTYRWYVRSRAPDRTEVMSRMGTFSVQ
jgi:hypothetical protein